MERNRKLIALLLVLIFCISSLEINTMGNENECVHEESHFQKKELVENNLLDGVFLLGNTSLNIFQGGEDISAEGIYYVSTNKGLINESEKKYVTNYKVNNLNYFPETIYYTVNDEKNGNSRIESLDVVTGEIRILYTHPSKIGQMYCINNEFFLFIADNSIYKVNNNDPNCIDIIASFDIQKQCRIFGLIPTRYGNIVIGNNDFDYTIYAEETLLYEHVYNVFEEKGYLILTYQGETYQVNIAELFNFIHTWSKSEKKNHNIDNEKELNCYYYNELNSDSTIVSGPSVIRQLNTGTSNDVRCFSELLLEKCSLYPMESSNEAFEVSCECQIQGTIDEEKTISNRSYQDEAGIYEANEVKGLLRSSNYPTEPEWTQERVDELKAFLGRITLSATKNSENGAYIMRKALLNARSLMEVEWVFNSSISLKDKYSTAGHWYISKRKYMGLPYQWGNTYVGFALSHEDPKVSIEDFLKATRNENSAFYSYEYDENNNPEWNPAYGTDCSGFVSYVLCFSEKKGTGNFRNQEECKVLEKLCGFGNNETGRQEFRSALSKLNEGDFIVNRHHSILIANVFKEDGKVKGVITLESRTLTTSSPRNINVYVDYSDEGERQKILRGLFYADTNGNGDLSVIDKWLEMLTKGLYDFGKLKENCNDGGSENGYKLYRTTKWTEIKHEHQCGVTVKYNDEISDDVCCLSCYNDNHPNAQLDHAPHWNGGNGNNTTCVFCGTTINHTHIFSDWYPSITNARQHERRCNLCDAVEIGEHNSSGIWCGTTGICYICGANVMSDYTTHDYEYVDNNASTHTKRCRRSGCGYEIEEKHTPKQQGGIECICGRIICKHNSTNKEIDADGHVITCSVCQELISRGKHNFKPYRAGNEPIYNGIIDIELHGDICKQDSLDKVDDSRICLYTADNGALSAFDTIDPMGVVDPAIGHNLICIDCGYIAKGTAPHIFTDVQQISGNASCHKLVCECGFSLEVSHSFKIEDAVKQGCHKYCTECGYEEYYDHDYTAYKVTKEATCTEKGEKSRTCKVCGHVKVKEIPATGHDYSKTETKEVKCKENGYERIVCSRCGDIQSETIIPYPGHDYESPVIISKATCTEPGRRTKRCKTCGFVKEYNYPDAKGHNYETKTVDATCTTDGYTREVCSRCGDIKSETVLSKTGHNYGEYVVTKEATCTSKGEKTRTCSNCGQTSSKKIPATGHSYGAFSVTSPASCTSTGTKSRTCSKCGHVDTEVIPLEPHKYNKKGKCKVCGAKK